MATKTGIKTDPTMAPEPNPAQLRTAQQVHTLAHVLYGQMVGRHPGMTLPVYPVNPGTPPMYQAPMSMAGPAHFPWTAAAPPTPPWPGMPAPWNW